MSAAVPAWAPALAGGLLVAALLVVYLMVQVTELRRSMAGNRRSAREELAADHRLKVLEQENRTLHATLETLLNLRPEMRVLVPPPPTTIAKPPSRIMAVLPVSQWEQLDGEAHKQALREIAGPWRDILFIEAGEATRAGVLRSLRRTEREGLLTKLLYFMGHGADGRLLLWESEELRAGWLARQMQEYGVEVALLMACYSDSLSDALLRQPRVQAVIGTGSQVSAQQAIRAMQAFLEAIADGDNARDALRYARNLIDDSTGERLRFAGNEEWEWT